MLKNKAIKLSKDFSSNFFIKSPIAGLTHNLYQYPARFSPMFAKTVIENFSKPGDLILDPFMGSGTTLVEAMVAGRKCLGTDISPLAVFIAKTKTTRYSEKHFLLIIKWWKQTRGELNLRNQINADFSFWEEQGYFRNMPWRIRKMVGLILDSMDCQPKKVKNLLRCVLLSATKTALEAPISYAKIKDFLKLYEVTLLTALDQCRDLSTKVNATQAKSVDGLMLDANFLTEKHFSNIGFKKVNLVVSSPPYPGVHILYHRWQIDGSKETAAPFWIVGSPDGQGDSFYTLGGRSKKGIQSYFFQIENIYSNIHSLLAKNAFVFQMVAFSNITEHLPLFNQAMENAGYVPVTVQIAKNSTDEDKYGHYVTRRVPLRKWYADLKGKTDSSLEFLLVHKKK